MKINEGGSILNCVNLFNIVTNQLLSLNIKFDDEIRALLILCSLPDSWNSLVMAVSNFASTKLVFEEVVGIILSEDMRRKCVKEISSMNLLVENKGI